MNWQIFALVSIVTASVSTLFERSLMDHDESDPISFAIFFQFILGFTTLGFALLFGKFVLPNIVAMWPQYLISTVLWSTSTVASLTALKYLQAGEATIIGTSSTVISVMLGVIFFRENITVVTIGGIALILLAVYIIAAENVTFKSKTGIMFAIASAVCGAIAVINDIVILKTYEAFSYTTVMSLLPGITLLAVFPQRLIKYRHTFNLKFLKKIAILAVFYSMQAITYYIAIEHNAPISKLSPLTRSSIILTVILAAIFLNERSHLPRKIFAAMVVTAGAILIG